MKLLRSVVIENPTPLGGQVDGNYLIIQYNEQATEIKQNGCVTRPGKKKGCNRSTLAWGGAVLGLYVALRFAGGWTAPHPGITQMTVSHGPTMPPDPTEPYQ